MGKSLPVCLSRLDKACRLLLAVHRGGRGPRGGWCPLAPCLALCCALKAFLPRANNGLPPCPALPRPALATCHRQCLIHNAVPEYSFSLCGDRFVHSALLLICPRFASAGDPHNTNCHGHCGTGSVASTPSPSRSRRHCFSKRAGNPCSGLLETCFSSSRVLLYRPAVSPGFPVTGKRRFLLEYSGSFLLGFFCIRIVIDVACRSARPGLWRDTSN